MHSCTRVRGRESSAAEWRTPGRRDPSFPMAGTPRKRGNKESASRDLDSLEFVVPVVGARFTAAAAAASGDVSGGARSWRCGTVRLLRMAAPGLLQIATETSVYPSRRRPAAMDTTRRGAGAGRGRGRADTSRKDESAYRRRLQYLLCSTQNPAIQYPRCYIESPLDLRLNREPFCYF